jgi:leucine dehydrogenase
MTAVLEQALVLEEIFIPGYEKVLKVTQSQVGLNAIICIHNTTMGPALGGIRVYPYATFEAALNDVLRLSKGMTYKSAITESGWGGGKSVIIADPQKLTKEMLYAFGQAVDRLQGQYICAEDLGCTPNDVLEVSKATPYVVGLPHARSSGNPSPFTAWGTYRGIQSVLKKITNSDSVENCTVAIQGLGSVGYALAQLLFWNGAQLIVSDIDSAKCQSIAVLTGAKIVSSSTIFSEKCDVFAPCALGGVINEQTIPLLCCKAIAGCANNQLQKDTDADELLAKGILYAPDFVINAGGLINVTQELASLGYNPTMARNKVNQLYDQLMILYEIAQQNHFSTHRAALLLADHRLKYRIGKRIEAPCFHHAK